MATLDRRVTALETKVRDVENGFNEALYLNTRELIRTQITLAELAAQSGVRLASDEAVDARLEELS
ncbi:hypothetical protein [Nocardia transvalensis]|uniref:hypothetical protein n=1 Tax=Nocardia transvalensis TaxID=37333 RepID=UPI00189378B7|nr:hypothetical protein [Nocardia transvalensis]MBF6330556.1 hypothetical protein [Nocardia transvalensis]